MPRRQPPNRHVFLVNGKAVATDKTAAYALTVSTTNLAKKMKVQARAYDRASKAGPRRPHL
jgi:hypothetical protein